MFDVESNGLLPEKNKPRYAHRTILAAASPYFNAMFTSDFVEAVDAKRQQVKFYAVGSFDTINYTN